MLLHILLSLSLLLPASQSETGYIKCYPGTLNVILSAPHHGYELPEEIPDRTDGCYDEINEKCIWTHDCGEQSRRICHANVLNDRYTQILVEILADKLEKLTSRRPHVVINNLSRRKLDANREIGEAAMGVPAAVAAYNEFHDCIEEAKAAIESDLCVSGTGLFLDIHGHGHTDNWAELGYLPRGNELDSNHYSPASTSIRYLLSRSPLDSDIVLRGNQSLGYFLEAEGYTAVPSPVNPGPNGKHYYFNGGYNTNEHGSKYSGRIDAIQIESSSQQRSSSERHSYAEALAKAVVRFIGAHYPRDDDSEACFTSSVETSTTDSTSGDG